MKNEKPLTIGRLAALTGTTADTLRYYEKMLLIKSTSRSPAGYRLYDDNTVRVVKFIRGAQTLNYRLVEIKKLLHLNTNDRNKCADMLKQTEQKIMETNTKISELGEIKKVLSDLINSPPQNDRKVTLHELISKAVEFQSSDIPTEENGQ